MKSYTQKLGELQQTILIHMAECKEESETVNHVAQQLNLAQPTVFKSVKLLMDGKYIEAQQEYKRGPKILTLTDKGAAAAVTSGIDLDQYETFTKKQGSNLIQDFLHYLGQLTTTSEKRNLMFQKAMEYFLSRNLFEKGYIRDRTPEEDKKLVQYIASEYTKSLAPASNIKTFEEFINRYQVNKEFLKAYLSYHKEMINKFLEKLGDD